MATHLSWKHLTQLGPFRWNQVAPARAARGAIGVVVPLALGWASGQVDFGAYAALGALPAGIVSFQGEARSRVAAVVQASIGMALSTLIGATTAAMSPWLLVPIVALWGYFTGLSVSLGQRWSVAVLQWSIALLIAVGLPFGPGEALLRAALVLAGGLFQAGLVAASWALRPGSRERVALADCYRALAAYASSLAAGKFEAPPAAFPAGVALTDANPLLPTPVRLIFIDLLEEAERIRASLAALATADDESELRALMSDAAIALGLIADALIVARAGRLPLIRELRQRLVGRSIVLQSAWRWAGEGLLGQLRAVGRTVANLERARAREPTESPEDRRLWATAYGSVAQVLLTLRANVTSTSEAGRHALRLAAIAALAEAITQATGLYQGRWVALTVFLILKPDYAATLYRGVQRAVGTAIGAVLAAAADITHPGPGGQIVGAGLCIATAYALFDASYLLFSVFLTAFILVLLELLGSPGLLTAEARFIDTFIGAALALAAYLAWPTWEGSTAQEKFARLMEAHRDYATALLRALARPGSVDAARLRALQVVARRARSDAEAAAARISNEPARASWTIETVEPVIAAVARLAHAELALHALALPPTPATERADIPDIASTRIDALATAIETAMNRLASACRTLSPPDPIPPLRQIHAQLRSEAIVDSAVVGFTDRLIDAINTLDAIMRERFAAAFRGRPVTADEQGAGDPSRPAQR
ncbi:MAG TPA: FUSC family protein [Stellaceae bacterium]|nr:FUSC family protein [Stellaceae bacterium]